MKFKICSICKKTKEFNKINFAVDKAVKSGLRVDCRNCKQKRDRFFSRKYRLENPEWKKLSNKKNLLKQNELIKEYNKKYPERVKAVSIANQAVKKGILKKQNCIICQSEKTIKHHPDYKYPLKVLWLCQLHHKQLHAKIIKVAALPVARIKNLNKNN